MFVPWTFQKFIYFLRVIIYLGGHAQRGCVKLSLTYTALHTCRKKNSLCTDAFEGFVALGREVSQREWLKASKDLIPLVSKKTFKKLKCVEYFYELKFANIFNK